MASYDIHSVEGRKVAVSDPIAALAMVRAQYPNAMREGSTGTYSFWVDGYIVAEMWEKQGRSRDWWLRIATTPRKL